MLTIQPNFSKRIHSSQAFGNQTAVMIIPKTEVLPEDNYIDYEIIGPSRGNRDEFEREVVDAEFEEITDEDAPKNTTALAVREQNTPVKNNAQEDNLNDIKNNINATMDNLKEVQKELPPAAQKVMGGLFTLGAAAVSGISVKYGFTETNKLLGKLFQKPSMKKFGENFVKPFKAAWKGVKTFFKDQYSKFKTTDLFKNMKKSFENFKKTKFGKKVVNLYERFVKSKPVQETKEFVDKVRGVKSEQVTNAAGDVLGVATGVSTGVAATIEPDKVKDTI